MFRPTIEQIQNLLAVREALAEFSDEFQTDYDPNDELDESLNQMITLINEGFNSILEEMKHRL